MEESPPTPVEFRVFFFGSILSFAASWGFGVWAAWRWNDTWKQSLPFLFNLAGSGLVLWLLSTEFAGESLGLVIGWFVGLVVLAALGWGAALATPIMESILITLEGSGRSGRCFLRHFSQASARLECTITGKGPLAPLARYRPRNSGEQAGT